MLIAGDLASDLASDLVNIALHLAAFPSIVLYLLPSIALYLRTTEHRSAPQNGAYEFLTRQNGLSEIRQSDGCKWHHAIAFTANGIRDQTRVWFRLEFGLQTC